MALLRELVRLIVDNNWGDIASVLGVLISLVGFAVTIRRVVQSKKAAQKAEEAVLIVKDKILRSDTIMDFSASITVMEEIKRLHRADAWPILPDRYSSLRKMLISIKTNNSNLPENHQAALQSAIQHFSDIEKKLSAHLLLKRIRRMSPDLMK